MRNRFMSKMFGKMTKQAKASGALFIANLLNKSIALLVSPIYTRILSKQEYGDATTYYTWLSLIGIVAMFSLSNGVINNGLLEYKDKKDDYLASMLCLSNLITVITFGIVVIIKVINPNFLDLSWPFVVVMFIVYYTEPAYLYWVRKQRFEYKYKASALISVLLALLSTACAILCIFVFPQQKLYARVFGAEIVLIFAYICFYIRTLQKSKERYNKEFWRFAFFFNLPLIPHYLSTYVLSSSDKLMIRELLGSDDTAVYGLAYSVAAVVTMIWTSINGSLVPYTYEMCEQNKYERLSKLVSRLLIFYGGACAAVIFLAPEIVMVLAPAEYKDAVRIVPVIVVGVFCQSLYYIFANIVYYHKRPKYVMVASITSAGLNIVLNYLLIPRYGVIAAGYTTLICYGVQAVIDYFAMKAVVHKKVYNTYLIGMIVCGLLFLMFISNVLYAHTFVRYGIVIIVLLLLILFRKKIVDVFKNKEAV